MKKTDLIVGIPTELRESCRCVGFVPEMTADLTKRGHSVLVQRDAGSGAFLSNEQYEEAGAKILDSAEQLYGRADVILKFHPPRRNEPAGRHELDLMKKGAAIMGFLYPDQDHDIMEKLIDNGLSGFAMEHLPRISRAQSMDALSTLSTISGYRSVLLAANYLGKFFPMLMTAAGTVRPATVLVIGAGVAGLQAIATAHRLGARVEAFDTRPAVKEQIESLGARFVTMELPEGGETKYGYATEMTEEFVKKEMEAISSRLPKTDVVITTALIYGREAPLLITEEMVRLMPAGAVIIDIAAAQGGNCALTRAGETVEKYGVTVYGAVDLPSQSPLSTSLMYSRNLYNAFNNLYAGEDDAVDLEDEVNKNALVTYKGEVISELMEKTL